MRQTLFGALAVGLILVCLPTAVGAKEGRFITTVRSSFNKLKATVTRPLRALRQERPSQDLVSPRAPEAQAAPKAPRDVVRGWNTRYGRAGYSITHSGGHTLRHAWVMGNDGTHRARGRSTNGTSWEMRTLPGGGRVERNTARNGVTRSRAYLPVTGQVNQVIRVGNGKKPTRFVGYEINPGADLRIALKQLVGIASSSKTVVKTQASGVPLTIRPGESYDTVVQRLPFMR